MKLNDRPKAGEKIVVFLLFLKQILTKILNLDSTDFGTEICVSSFQNFMELFETQFYWKQFQKLLSGNPAQNIFGLTVLWQLLKNRGFAIFENQTFRRKYFTSKKILISSGIRMTTFTDASFEASTAKVEWPDPRLK